LEPFRPAIVDSAVISAINTGMVQRSSFEANSSACILKPSGRKAFIQAYESRLAQLIPVHVVGQRDVAALLQLTFRNTQPI
jgi:CRISPR-associated protein Cas1